MRSDYGPYAALNALYFHGRPYFVNKTHVETIRLIVENMKHELFSDSFEKIFISHREKDREQVSAFIDLLYAIGIPRPTIHDDNSIIFCTSHPNSYIDSGERNLDEIKRQFNSSEHVFFILWYSDYYFESQACVNEAGAIWAMGKKYQEILMPNFDATKIGGLMDRQRVWFRANDKLRLNRFKERLESMFDLNPIEQNAWEISRQAYVSQIQKEIERVDIA